MSDVQYKTKKKGWILRAFTGERVWVTIGRTIYHPADANPLAPRYRVVMGHEKEHVRQGEEMGFFLHGLLYVLGCPFPLFFAWYRYKCEREAYLKWDIAHGHRTVEQVADILWSPLYFWAWPKAWTIAWLDEQLGRR